MAVFSNFATLSYTGGTAVSNTVTGEILETVSATKTAVSGDYSAGENQTYVITLNNSDAAPITGLTVTDDLGGYEANGTTVYPLAYRNGTLRYYVNGALQAAPVVTAGPPMTVTGITVPAGGNAMLIFETEVTGFAPLATGGTISNTAAVTGGGLTVPVTANAVVAVNDGADLAISKSVSPATVNENGQLTYTFIIENRGNAAADAAENVVLNDTFDPILDPITVTYNGTTWTEGVNYNYDETTGVFATLQGQITVPAAAFAQNADGLWITTPGTATLVVSGTV